jgi:hypothetical protein
MSTPSHHEISEERMMQLTRNALYVAGVEMGEKGDHWPVINSTIRSVMQDWEELKIERAVHEEMKVHLYKQLEAMEQILPECSREARKNAAPKLKELRELYDAYFTDIDESRIYADKTGLPLHVLRAEVILDTLEG